MSKLQKPEGQVTVVDPEREAALARSRKLAELLDSTFQVPGTNFRIGVEAIIGLLPGVGDAVSSMLSTYILYEAARVGASRTTLVRMFGNILFDTLIGLIPLVGDLFDFVFKANSKNARLLEQELHRTAGKARNDSHAMRTLIGLALVIVLLLVLCVVLVLSGLLAAVL
ncbi:MAG: DUF4112 domain-containing protein [Bdellovibrionales bacterium]|nr:DUF4112 domain-containing protein [Bdellovibrionales bacterium]